MAESMNAFEAEIKELEAKLESKKREMAEAGKETTEKETFSRVVREHAGTETPVVNFPASAAPAAAPAVTPSVNPQTEQVLDTLVQHAFTKGIKSAVAEAKKMNMPYFIDMLHDRLVDEYYQKLIESRRVKSD